MNKIINELDYQIEGYLELKPHEKARMLKFFIGVAFLIVLVIIIGAFCGAGVGYCV